MLIAPGAVVAAGAEVMALGVLTVGKVGAVVAVEGVLVVGIEAVGAGVLAGKVGTDSVPVTAELWVAGGTVVTVLGEVALFELDGSSASLTSAALSTPRDSTITTLSMIIGARQFAGAASRVRAAAPQLRHQSCSGMIGIPHRGQASVALVVGGVPRLALIRS